MLLARTGGVDSTLFVSNQWATHEHASSGPATASSSAWPFLVLFWGRFIDRIDRAGGGGGSIDTWRQQYRRTRIDSTHQLGRFAWVGGGAAPPSIRLHTPEAHPSLFFCSLWGGAICCCFVIDRRRHIPVPLFLLPCLLSAAPSHLTRRPTYAHTTTTHRHRAPPQLSWSRGRRRQPRRRRARVVSAIRGEEGGDGGKGMHGPCARGPATASRC